MEGFNKLQPIEAAHQFLNKYFPNCQGALLAGSIVRGEATATSDLDIVILDTNTSPYRESFVDFGWQLKSLYITLHLISVISKAIVKGPDLHCLKW